jgi:hypothetical protein
MVIDGYEFHNPHPTSPNALGEVAANSGRRG